jgi:very-short-patch-repair endonuclease
MLAIEIDGSSHNSEAAQQRDLARQTRLESLDVKFLRFREEEVRNQTAAVVAAIADWVAQHRT